MNALTAVFLRSLLLVFSITMTITEIYTCKYVEKKKKTKISFLQKTLSSKFHEVSPATAQKSIKKFKIILFTLANLKFLKKIMVEKEEDASICCEPNFLLYL